MSPINWIEGKPPFNKAVLVTDGREVMATICDDYGLDILGVCGWDVDCKLDFSEITHWAPIQLPTGKEVPLQ